MFGARLAEERKRLGLTQRDLAAFLGVGRSAVAMIEIGKSGMDAVRLARLRSIGFDLEYLLFAKPSSYQCAEHFNWDLFIEVIERVIESCRRVKVRLPKKKTTAIIRHAYLQFANKGTITDDVLESLLEIAGVTEAGEPHDRG